MACTSGTNFLICPNQADKDIFQGRFDGPDVEDLDSGLAQAGSDLFTHGRREVCIGVNQRMNVVALQRHIANSRQALQGGDSVKGSIAGNLEQLTMKRLL